MLCTSLRSQPLLPLSAGVVLLRGRIDHTIVLFLPVENECYLLARSTSNPDENECLHVLGHVLAKLLWCQTRPLFFTTHLLYGVSNHGLRWLRSSNAQLIFGAPSTT